jgi:hypothetical protein
MIRVLANGDDRHRLEDAAGRDIGWIRGRVIGFRGLESDAQAIDAVGAIWPVFDAALSRTYFGRPRQDVRVDELRLVHDGAYEWVSDGQHPLARLHRPRAGHRGDGLAIELVLPTYANEGVAITIAQVVGRALQSHLAPDDAIPALDASSEPAALGA